MQKNVKNYKNFFKTNNYPYRTTLSSRFQTGPYGKSAYLSRSFKPSRAQIVALHSTPDTEALQKHSFTFTAI
jgi:hypothetical protein